MSAKTDLQFLKFLWLFDFDLFYMKINNEGVRVRCSYRSRSFAHADQLEASLKRRSGVLIISAGGVTRLVTCYFDLFKRIFLSDVQTYNLRR